MATAAVDNFTDHAVEAGVAFLAKNCSFQSSGAISDLSDKLRVAAEVSADAYFQVPIREKVLPFDKALLWANFVAHAAPIVAMYGANGNPPLNLNHAVGMLNQVYDLAFQDELEVCWRVEEDEEDEEGEGDEEDEEGDN